MKPTKLFCTGLVIAATIYDVIALSFFGVDGTISHWFAAFSAYPVPVFGAGFLAGHFFGSMKDMMPVGTQTDLKRLASDMRRSSNEMKAWADRLDAIVGGRK